MPIIDKQDASDVEEFIKLIFAAEATYDRFNQIQRLFVEKLDFCQVLESELNLDGARRGVTLPESARVVARMEETHVVYVDLAEVEIDTNRVRKSEAAEAARLIERQLSGDLLLVFTNRDRDQLHFILPSFEGRQPSLRRMIVERDLPRRTAVQQLSNIYWEWELTSNIRSALESAFDVEAVTKEFFAEYKRVFNAAKEKISGFEDDDTKHVFVQTLFNRLMFVYFLSRKGWLRFNGNNDYLNALWRSYVSAEDQTNFYVDRLRQLFFAGLNNPSARDLIGGNSALAKVIGEVPFLNGGLFDKGQLDQDADIAVPDDAIEPIFSELFDKFNFTVMESTPLDVEVAVDPEMLGKVFEEMVNERHDSGAYYTPRPVVSFMCREALKGYLASRDTGLTEDAISRFVDERDTSEISLSEAHEISRNLMEITVVDPACGSGAYLLGMMQELVDLQSALYSDQLRTDARTLYRQKLDIIEKNLYGVDKEEFAVNIAMLRLWLSLVIEYEGDHPEPLPNLDYKIVCGDSLLGPDPSSEGGADFYRHMTQRMDLRGKKAQYMLATDGRDKSRFRDEIHRTEQRIRETLGDAAQPAGIVDWAIDFADVFAEKDGFDVVVANPPYGITVNNRRSEMINHTDSYTNFMTLVGEIARNGVMAYITPTSWETGDKFDEFRRQLFRNLNLHYVINLPYDVFDVPNVDTAITIGSLGNVSREGFHLATFEKRADLDFRNLHEHAEFVDWKTVDNNPNNKIPLLVGAEALFNRLTINATPLGQLTESRRGIPVYKHQVMDDCFGQGVPLFAGQVFRFVVDESFDGYVELNRNTKRFHEGIRLMARRLVNRQNRLAFARTSSTFAVKEALLPFISKSLDERKMTLLLGILNSKLISFLYLNRSTAATKDDFRQVTLNGLRELPVIFPSTPELEKELIENVERRENESVDTAKLETNIDAIIYDIYGVTVEEREMIEDWLTRSG